MHRFRDQPESGCADLKGPRRFSSHRADHPVDAAPITEACVAATTHGDTFASVVERGNVFGVQFHPEKSSDAGLRIIRNFLEVTRSTPSAAATGAEAEC